LNNGQETLRTKVLRVGLHPLHKAWTNMRAPWWRGGLIS